MNINCLVFLDYFFLIFHTSFTIFNVFAWTWRKTRKMHLITAAVTLFSWFVMGIWYGWGYCFCTDWHWQVRDAMGNPIESYSYIHFLILEYTGMYAPPDIVDLVVMWGFVSCVILSILFNYRDFRNRKRLP
ncbi:MAG: DUF2784 domain-containing protein [bacterium]|nr:DUF2784 domain-containing protein [bacterium]